MTPKEYLLEIGFDDAHLPELFNNDDKSYYQITELMEEYAKQKDERIKELEEVLNTTLFDSDCVNNVTNLSVFNRQVIENCLKK